MIRGLVYNETEIQDLEGFSLTEGIRNAQSGSLVWMDFDNSSGPEFQELVQSLELHPLLAEDIQNRFQLPKFESFGNIDFLSIQMIKPGQAQFHVQMEHLSMLMGNGFLITVQDDRAGDVFDNIRNKLKNNPRKYFKNGLDFLFLSLVDAIVDQYMATIHDFRQPLEETEKQMLKRPGFNFMSRIINYKTELSTLRKYTSPLREEVQRIRVENPELIRKQNMALFRDILDHLNTLNANYENLRDMLRDLSDLHMSNQNLVLGNTMKTLTVISAIFIPLTFIVGVYGMNFDYMPWLHARYGFWMIAGFMLLITFGLIWFMKRKKWF